MASSVVTPLKPTARSRVGNGATLWLDEKAVDARSKAARRFTDILGEIVIDLGGHDRLSEGQRQIARRCAMLFMQCELLESQAIAGEDFDIETYGVLTDRLGRAFQRLGFAARPNATVSLADVLALHRVEGAETDE